MNVFLEQISMHIAHQIEFKLGSFIQAEKRKLGLLDDEGDEELGRLAKEASNRSSDFDKRKKPKTEVATPQGRLLPSVPAHKLFFKSVLEHVEEHWQVEC